MLKSALRAQVHHAIDDESTRHWSAANLDILIGNVIDELWTEILDMSPWYLSALDTITTGPKLVSPGYIETTALAQRFHRLQLITRDGMHYREQHPLSTLIASNVALSGSHFTYRFYGSQIWLLPLSMTNPIEMRYSYKPALYTSLGDGAAITFPDGHEACVIYKAAARAMVKGGREDNATQKAEFAEAYSSLISHVARRQIGPQQPWDTSSTYENAGI